MTRRWDSILLSRVHLLILLPAAIYAVILPETFVKECTGTSDGLTMSGSFNNDPFQAHRWYEQHYTNCTHVLTNLEIVNLNPMDGTSLDVSFLENIREVHGYVLISMVYSHLIPLTSLRLIRGRFLFKLRGLDPVTDINYDDVQKGCSLYISSNSHGDYGIRELQLPELQDILKGNVRIRGNRHMCFDGKTTIDWKYILRSPDSKTLYYNDDTKDTRCDNMECDKNCSANLDGENVAKLCWGPQSNMCQRVTRTNCSPTCFGRCFGPLSTQCCRDSACAGGCRGPTEWDCWACKKFNNSGQCVESCPRFTIYDEDQRKNVPNLDGRYTYGTNCVRQCPEHMYVDKENCVQSCGPEQEERKVDGKRSCEPCNGPCPKRCPGNDLKDEDGIMYNVNSANIANFTNCTIIEGGLEINDRTFTRDTFLGTEPLNMEALKALENVQEITHYLSVHSTPTTLKSLSFLRNLRVIRGQLSEGKQKSLEIYKTELESLGLVSLGNVLNGQVSIQGNPKLCYAEGIKWNTITQQTPTVRNNMAPENCTLNNFTCSNQCNMSRGCWGPGDYQCVVCNGFRRSDTRKCLTSCDDESGLYTDLENRQCHLCDTECKDSCTGPGAENCTTCRHARDGPYCLAECPPTKYLDADGNCRTDMQDQSNAAAIVGAIMAALIIITGLAVLLLILKQKLTKTEERKLKLRAQLSGLADPQEFELSPSNVKPDMSQLRICKESELRTGQVIGSGAFGTVYKGVFIPERENVKIPVAIKEISEASSNPHSNNELLEEARIMAAVVHPCCIRIMAVCLTKKLMLITPLMPFGALLDYLHKNRSSIGSRSLLLWAQQIADGMNYLQSLGIVHRDLAARNVLVHSSSQLKITDFGLAKLLASDEYYLSTGGKLPVKWLALECIQCRLFTHKSDVWAYGVTLWEMFTFGQKPYEDVQAVDMRIALEKGHRLPQPTTCTIDVYMLMIKCWMVDVDSRPTFAELSSEFSKMAKDPARFIVIQGDELLQIQRQEPQWRDLMRAMSITSDGPETLISAEDYLHPQDVNRKPLDGVSDSYMNFLKILNQLNHRTMLHYSARPIVIGQVSRGKSPTKYPAIPKLANVKQPNSALYISVGP